MKPRERMDRLRYAKTHVRDAQIALDSIETLLREACDGNDWRVNVLFELQKAKKAMRVLDHRITANLSMWSSLLS